MASSAIKLRRCTMRYWVFLSVIFLSGVGMNAASAQQTCFSAEETRVNVAQFGLVSLHDVVRSARGGSQADLISARLCETNGNMVYMIAMLGRDGRVMRMTVDARTGNVINNR
jgi:uncharacterized membrane protein YkoI